MKTKQFASRTVKTTTKVLASAVVVATMSFSVNSLAASDCKGLQNSACDANASCRWVDGYQRKDNRKVKAFCRSYSAKVNLATANKDRQKSTDVVKKKSSAATLSSKRSAGKK